MKSKLVPADHTELPGEKVVEIWHDGQFIGQACGSDRPGIRILSKYPMKAIHDLMVTEVLIGDNDDIWNDEQCFKLNSLQHDGHMHPYTCGKNSKHRPLIATRQGWRCADCDYCQKWSHETGENPLQNNPK